jgi:hypothetical protein
MAEEKKKRIVIIAIIASKGTLDMAYVPLAGEFKGTTL